MLKELNESLAAETGETPRRHMAPHALQALRDRLFADVECIRATGPASLYVLVDPSLRDPLATAERRDRAIALPLRVGQIPATAVPYLLPLGDFGRDDTIDLTLDLAWAEGTRQIERDGRGTHICGWIACPTDKVGRVALAIAENSRRHHLLPGRGWFRSWDPRVLELLDEIRPQAFNLFPPEALRWWWLTRAGTLTCRSDGRGSATATLVDERMLLPRIGALNATLNALQDADHDVSNPPLTRTLLTLFARAESDWGLHDDYDLIRFAVYGVLVSPDFDRRPAVQKAMQQARSSGVSPLDALKTFEPSDWETR